MEIALLGCVCLPTITRLNAIMPLKIVPNQNVMKSFHIRSGLVFVSLFNRYLECLDTLSEPAWCRDSELSGLCC